MATMYIATNKVNKQTALNAVISKLYVADMYFLSILNRLF